MTLTTHQAGGKGYEFYLDGKLVGATLAKGTYIGARSVLVISAAAIVNSRHDSCEGPSLPGPGP